MLVLALHLKLLYLISDLTSLKSYTETMEHIRQRRTLICAATLTMHLKVNVFHLRAKPNYL